MIKLWYIPAMIALVAVLHFGALWSGFYDWQFSTRVFWFDNVLHAFVGVGFAMAALYILERSGIPFNRMAVVGITLVVVFLLASLWELVEYIFFTRFTEYAYWSKLYSPSLTEAFSDIVSDVIGGAALLGVLWRRILP